MLRGKVRHSCQTVRTIVVSSRNMIHPALPTARDTTLQTTQLAKKLVVVKKLDALGVDRWKELKMKPRTVQRRRAGLEYEHSGEGTPDKFGFWRFEEEEEGKRLSASEPQSLPVPSSAHDGAGP